MEVSDSSKVVNAVNDAERDIKEIKEDSMVDNTKTMAMKDSDSTKLGSLIDDVDQDIRDIKEDLIAENTTNEKQNEEEKKEETEAAIDDDEEECFSETSSNTEEEVQADVKVEEDAEEGEDDAYALLALAKRSMAQAKVAEENIKAEEIKDAEALKEEKDEDNEGVYFDDEVEDMTAHESISNQNDEVLKQDLIKEGTHVPVNTEDELKKQSDIKSKSEENATELKEKNQSSLDEAITQAVTSNDAPDDQPKKRREENAELWALLQASKKRLSLTQHHLKPDTIKSSKKDSKDDSDDEEVSDNPEYSGKKKQPQKNTILEEDEHDSDHNMNDKQQKSLDSRKTRDGTNLSLPHNQEVDAEDEKERRKQENAELWELLVQSKRRLEIVSPSTDAASTLAGTESTTTTNNDDLAQEKKNYLEDYELPNDLDDEDMENDSDVDEENKYDGEDEDQAAIRLSAKELLIAMATAEEAAMSGRDSHQTSVLPREELKRDLDTFAFIKSKCSISGPKRKQNLASSSSGANTPTNGSYSMAPLWNSVPKREKVINNFIASVKGFRSKANKVTKTVSSSPYSSPKFSSPKFSRNASVSSKTSSSSITDSSSLMMEKLKKSMKDFNETINTIDSKNSATARSSPRIVSTPVKNKKWQDRAAVVAEKNKK